MLAGSPHLLALRTSQRTASDYSHFMFRSAPRLVLVALSVRSRPLHGVSISSACSMDRRSSDPLTVCSGSRCAAHALRARDVARDAICGGVRCTTHRPALADSFVARSAASVAQSAFSPLAERLPDAVRYEARSASCRAQPVVSAEHDWARSGRPRRIGLPHKER